MNKIYFSAQTDSFYIEGINPTIPEGAIVITQEQHDALMAGASSGKKISHDENGEPILIDLPPLPDDLLIENCKALAKLKLQNTDWSQTLDIGTMLVNQNEFTTYRAQVRAIYFNPVTNPVWPVEPTAVWA
jgi:hypothetical protein